MYTKDKDYKLSEDGSVLLRWFNREEEELDMEADPVLRTITSIGEWGFSAGFNRLRSVVFPNSITEIKAEAFSGKELTSVVIPDNVKKIYAKAFYFNKLTSVILGENLNFIGDCSFGENQITSLTMGKKLYVIGSCSFLYNQLSSVEIPNKVRIIGAYAFGNNKLESITLPKSVKEIGSGAFVRNEITYAEIKASTPPVISNRNNGKNIFDDNPLQKIIVPKDSVEAYKNAEGWKEYANIIVGE